MIAVASASVAATIRAVSEFGRRWRNRMRLVGAPIDRAAIT